MPAGSGFVNVFDTGHTALTVHSAQIWSEYVASEKDLPSEFEKRMSKYDRQGHGHRNVRPAERDRFIKTALNYRVHDLPHGHNPETDHFVPSFSGFPLPARGSDKNDMSGMPRAHGAAATFPGGSAVNPRKCKDVDHGTYHSIDATNPHKVGTTFTLPGARDGDVLGSIPGDYTGPSLYPKRYEKKMSTMQWRGYIKEDGKNNKNHVLDSTYGRCFKLPGSNALRTSSSLRRLDAAKLLM